MNFIKGSFPKFLQMPKVRTIDSSVDILFYLIGIWSGKRATNNLLHLKRGAPLMTTLKSHGVHRGKCIKNCSSIQVIVGHILLLL